MNLRTIFFGEWRISRVQFLIFMPIVFIINYIIDYLLGNFFWEGYYMSSNILGVFDIFYSLIISFLITSLIIRRGHDISIPTLVWILLCLYMFIDSLFWIIYMPVFSGSPGSFTDSYYMTYYINVRDILSVILLLYCIVIAFIGWKFRENNK